jgi:DNA-binding beta-propeller fold protein YncE
VSNVHNGSIYHFKLNKDRTALVLSGALADKVADTNEETKGIMFGSNFGGISDLVVGPDGYLYVVSLGRGTIYRIVPVTATTTNIPLPIHQSQNNQRRYSRKRR